MNYFYVPQLTPKHEFVMMPEEEAKHALKVLRMRVSDPIVLIDGNGGKYTGIIYSTENKRCEVRIDEYEKQERSIPYRLHLAISPTKNMERMEWLMEKAVEIGVDQVSFLHTKHSERKVLKLERIKKIAVSAMKQSGNLHLPKITDLKPFKEFLGNIEEEGRYIAYVPTPSTDTLAKAIEPKDACILVGAEGGFTEEEVELAQEKNFIPVSLSPYRLRTETAGLLALHTLSLKLSELEAPSNHTDEPAESWKEKSPTLSNISTMW